MTLHLSDLIRRRLDWCPVQSRFQFDTVVRECDPAIPACSSGSALREERTILDSGSTGISPRHFIAILCGMAAGLFIVMEFNLPGLLAPLFFLVLGIPILGSAAGILVHDGMTATVSGFREGIILVRPFFGPVVIRRDEITMARVLDNEYFTYRLPLFAATTLLGAVFILIGLVTLQGLSGILGDAGGFGEVWTIYILSMFLFLWLLLFRGFLRSWYPRMLAIRTQDGRSFGVYRSDPEQVAVLLSGSSGHEIPAPVREGAQPG